MVRNMTNSQPSNKKKQEDGCMNSLHQHNWSPKASTNTSMILWLPGGLAQHLVLLEFISIYSWLPWVYYYYHPPAASSIHLAAIVVSSPLTTSTAHDLTLFGWFLSISLLWAGPAVVLLKTEVLTFLLLLSQHSKSLVLIILLLADNTCWTLAIKHSSLYSFTELADCHCATFKHHVPPPDKLYKANNNLKTITTPSHHLHSAI